MDINITMCIFLFLFDVGEAVEGGWGGSDGMGEGAGGREWRKEPGEAIDANKGQQFCVCLKICFIGLHN